MPLVFLNGSAPVYDGFTFTTPTQLINQLETTLVAAGWLTVTKVAATSLFIKGTSIIGGNNCWVDFIVSGTSPSLTLTMRAWQEEAKTTGSPNTIHTMTFYEGATNRMWLTADAEAGCICVFDASLSTSAGYHFGFLDRTEATDPWAWMIGRINSMGYTQAYVAKSKFNNTNWKQLSTDFTNYAATTGEIAVPNSTFDFMQRGLTTNGLFSAGSNNNVNPFYLAQNGRRNYDGFAVIDRYSYLEGKGSISAYPVPVVTPTYYRGAVKYAYCGVSSEAAGTKATDTTTGFKILSVGGVQWQGMRIL